MMKTLITIIASVAVNVLFAFLRKFVYSARTFYPTDIEIFPERRRAFIYQRAVIFLRYRNGFVYAAAITGDGIKMLYMRNEFYNI